MAANQNASYAGKVAFVTGAGSGVGRATALAFTRVGASVVVSDISEQNARDTARQIEELGGRALALACDVTRSEDVKAALEETIERPRRSPRPSCGCVRRRPPSPPGTRWSSAAAKRCRNVRRQP